MKLFALTEMKSDDAVRRFVFSNWDDEDDAGLEVQADGFSVTSL